MTTFPVLSGTTTAPNWLPAAGCGSTNSGNAAERFRRASSGSRNAPRLTPNARLRRTALTRERLRGATREEIRDANDMGEFSLGLDLDEEGPAGADGPGPTACAGHGFSRAGGEREGVRAGPRIFGRPATPKRSLSFLETGKRDGTLLIAMKFSKKKPIREARSGTPRGLTSQTQGHGLSRAEGRAYPLR